MYICRHSGAGSKPGYACTCLKELRVTLCMVVYLLFDGKAVQMMYVEFRWDGCSIFMIIVQT